MADAPKITPPEYVVSVTKLGNGAEWVLRKWVGDGFDLCDRDDAADRAAFDLADEHDWFGLPTGDYPLAVPDV
jgi:hypothetical protein